MKCIPHTSCGRPVAAARRPIGIDDVLEARIASGFRASSRPRKIRSLSSTSSLAASIASPASAAAATSVAVAMRASAAVGIVDLALGGELRERAADRRQRALELLLPHVDERHAQAGDRGDLGDAGAHLAGADDHEALDHGASTSITIASPWPPPEQIAASPRPPPRRRSS